MVLKYGMIMQTNETEKMTNFNLSVIIAIPNTLTSNYITIVGLLKTDYMLAKYFVYCICRENFPHQELLL